MKFHFKPFKKGGKTSPVWKELKNGKFVTAEILYDHFDSIQKELYEREKRYFIDADIVIEESKNDKSLLHGCFNQKSKSAQIKYAEKLIESLAFSYTKEEWEAMPEEKKQRLNELFKWVNYVNLLDGAKPVNAIKLMKKNNTSAN